MTPDMTAEEHLKQCAACNHGRTPCIEYQRVWPVERTAKARELELKAREFREHGEWPTVIPADYNPAWESRWEDRFAAAYVASERSSAIKEAREECARIAEQFISSGENKDNWTITRDVLAHDIAKAIRGER